MLADLSKPESAVRPSLLHTSDSRDFLVQIFQGARAGVNTSRNRLATLLVDRDGVINVNRPDHVTSWSDFAFIPAALEGLARLRQDGWRVVVLTNQAVVNRGELAAEDLYIIHQRMAREVRARGGEITAVFTCPHRPDERCSCRKPAPGLLTSAMNYFDLDPASTYFVGDHQTDLDAATRAGCHSILVTCGRGRPEPAGELARSCDAVLTDLAAAASFVTRRDIAATAARVGVAKPVGGTAC